MQRSIMWFLQMAQLSTTISQAQRATAFHFFTSKRFLPAPLLVPLGVSTSIAGAARGPGSGGPFRPPGALSRHRAEDRTQENPQEKAAAQGPVSSPTSPLPFRYFFSSRKVVPGSGEQAPGEAGEEYSR